MRPFEQMSRIGLAALVGVLVICLHSERKTAQSDEVPMIALTTLDGSLNPLIDRFNAESDKPRIVMLLAPS